MVCEDLCQLPPVRAKPVFIFNDTETMEGSISMDLCCKFRLAELDQAWSWLRQDDEIFVNMLNKIRVGEIDQNVEDKLCFIDKNDSWYPGNILHIFCRKLPN